jgi:ATP-dependent Lon protease
VLPVGGIKEKSLAARRAGITTFVLPRRNEVDLDDLPKELRDEMSFVLADRLDDVLATAMPEEFHIGRNSRVQRSADAAETREPVGAAT